MVLENFIVDAPIVWDRVGKKIFENPHVKQGRKMRVQITNAGMVEDLSGYTLALGWKHTVSGVDGLDVFEDSSEANVGIFEMAYTENLMTNLGNLKASLVLTSFEDMVVAESNDFYVKVDDSPFGADAEQGVGSYTRLAQILLNEEIRQEAYLRNEALVGSIDDKFDAFIQTNIVQEEVAEVFNNLEETYAQDLLSVKNGLEQAVAMQSGLLVFKGSDTTANINAKTGMVTGDYWWSTDGLAYFAYTGTAWSNVGSSLTELSDVRVGADGITYGSAGAAIRSQLSNYALKTSGKNLYDPNSSAIVNGKWMDYTGYIQTNAAWRYNVIPVVAGQVISINKAQNHIAFFVNQNVLTRANFISGSADTQNNITVPATAKFMTVSTPIASKLVQVEYGAASTAYVAFEKGITTTDLKNNIVTEGKLATELSAKMPFKTTGKNIFDRASAAFVTGYYVNYLTGQKQTNAAWGYLIIPCDPSTAYAFNKYEGQFAFFTNNDLTGYISGFLASANPQTFTTPATAKYMTVSLPTASTNPQIEKGAVVTAFEAYTFGLNGSEIKNKSITADKIATIYTTIRVDINGGKDFTSIKDAFASITGNSEDKQYIVEIYPGTYDAATYWTAEQIANPVYPIGYGLIIPDYVTLRGIGNKKNIIITANLATKSNYFSTLNPQNVCNLENLTVKGVKTRYTVHDDWQYPTMTKNRRVVKDCIFIGEDLYTESVYGSGVKGNAEWLFENCVFDARLVDITNLYGHGLYNHNNVNLTIGNKITFRNCRFLTNYTLEQGRTYGLYLGSMINGSANGGVEVILEGCKLNGVLLFENDPVAYGQGICYTIMGFGNDTGDIAISNTDAVDYSGNVDLI